MERRPSVDDEWIQFLNMNGKQSFASWGDSSASDSCSQVGSIAEDTFASSCVATCYKYPVASGSCATFHAGPNQPMKPLKNVYVEGVFATKSISPVASASSRIGPAPCIVSPRIADWTGAGRDEISGHECTNPDDCSSRKLPVTDLNETSQTSDTTNTAYELIISTKTKVLFLNQPINIHKIFWEIPIIEYWMGADGVIKKQMKIVNKTPEEYELYKAKLNGLHYYQENILKQINNPTARGVKYKDERKLTVGISKKDILTTRGKVKNAFYNCFALIMRLKVPEETFYREIHVKVFNTGKMEIPGVVSYKVLEFVKLKVLALLQSYVEEPLTYVENSHKDHVLINSNFNCGFFVNREKLHQILSSSKYEIESAFDPCSYPGVKCKYYYNNEFSMDDPRQTGTILPQDRCLKLNELIDSKKYTEISFMVFRTGSCLIVGNCTERILRFVFEFIKQVLNNEYNHIHILNEIPVLKPKKVKRQKRTITMIEPMLDANN